MAGATQFNAGDPRQSLALRPKVLNGIVANGAQINLVKTHNVRTRVFGVDLIPAHLTRSAIYVLRNPLDTVLSYARHYGHTPELAAAALGRRDTTVAGPGSVTQFIGNWSEHVLSWARCRDFPVLTLRYEDIHADPEGSFTKALEHLGVPVDSGRLDRAIRFSSFDEVRSQEERVGFIERSPQSERFFDSGRAGRWREELPRTVAERLRREHGRVMREFGYLAD